MSSINELSTYNDPNEGSININAPKDMQGGTQIHPDMNGIDFRFKIRDCIKQTKNEWKVAELSAKNMGKGLHKDLKAVVKKLNNKLTTLRESVS